MSRWWTKSSTLASFSAPVQHVSEHPVGQSFHEQPRSRGDSRVIAVIPTFNRKALVARVIEGVLSQSRPVSLALVVDNGSGDGTAEFLEESGYLDDERLVYMRLEQNMGFSAAFHFGVEVALTRSANWIWALDDDAVPDPRCLESLLDAASRQPDGRVGGLMSYQEQWVGGSVNYRFPRSVWEALRFGYGCPQTGIRPGDPVVPVDWFTSACALISADAVRAVGLPRDDLFYYADPLDYSLRLRAAGYRAYLVPESLVDHRSEAGPGKEVPAWRWYYVYRNTIFVLRNQAGQFGKPVQVAATTRMALGALWRMVRLAVRGNWTGARQIGRGVVDGYRGRLGQRILPSTSP